MGERVSPQGDASGLRSDALQRAPLKVQRRSGLRRHAARCELPQSTLRARGSRCAGAATACITR
eukprot:10009887-Alexandrium_andersonii.AAC.1